MRYGRERKNGAARKSVWECERISLYGGNLGWPNLLVVGDDVLKLRGHTHTHTRGKGGSPLVYNF